MSNQPVRPEDVLPDGVEGSEFGGEYVRKGSVAAFIGNVRALAETEPNSAEWDEIVAQLRGWEELGVEQVVASFSALPFAVFEDEQLELAAELILPRVAA